MSQPASKRTRGTLILGALALLVAPAVATAEEMVPTGLVVELLKMRPHYGSDEPTLILGSAPGELSEMLPEDLEILISLTSDRGSSVIARSDLTRSQLLGRLEAGFATQGWSRFRPETSEKGFQPSLEEDGMTLCHEKGGTLFVEAESRGEEDTSARLRYSEGRGYSSCKQMSRQARHMEDLYASEVPFPTLYPPEGAKSHGGGGSSSGEFERGASTYLEADITPGDILAHYGAQLGQQGWQPDTIVDYDALAYQSWLFLDDTGKEWHGLLMVKTNPRDEGKHEVELNVRFLGES